MPAHTCAVTRFHMLHRWFPSPHFSLPCFWYQLMLVSSVRGILFLNWAGFFRCFLFVWFFLAESNQPCLFFSVTQRSTSRSQPSVFRFMKASLDCRLACLLQSSLELGPCYEGFIFFNLERRVGELSCAFLFLQKVPVCWLDNCWSFCYLSDGFLLFFSLMATCIDAL